MTKEIKITKVVQQFKVNRQKVQKDIDAGILPSVMAQRDRDTSPNYYVKVEDCAKLYDGNKKGAPDESKSLEALKREKLESEINISRMRETFEREKILEEHIEQARQETKQFMINLKKEIDKCKLPKKYALALNKAIDRSLTDLV